MDLKALCKSYTWQGMTFWMLGYRNIDVDIAVEDLETIEPHWVYINKRTGEQSSEKPAALVKAEDNWNNLNVPDDKRKSDWELHNLWNITHNVFTAVLPLIVDVDCSNLDASATMEAKTFAAFWNDNSTDVAQRWQNFKRVVGKQTMTALLLAHEATRDDILEASKALQSEPAADASEEKKEPEPEPSTTS